MVEWDDDDYYWDDPEDEDEEEDYDDAPCSHCGPSCPEWAGDGLCMDEIRYQGICQEFYDMHCKLDLQTCPVCGKVLTLYEVPCDLWQWPGDWLPPIVALDIYAVYDCPKGVTHSFGKDLHHIWIGSANGREHLVATNCVRQDPDPGWVARRFEDMKAAEREGPRTG
jgi:hypothetical protein